MGGVMGLVCPHGEPCWKGQLFIDLAQGPANLSWKVPISAILSLSKLLLLSRFSCVRLCATP